MVFLEDMKKAPRAEKAHFVYILQSSDRRYYVGYTTDLERRMKQHREGKGAKFTRAFGFAKLLHTEEHPTRSEALKREAALKKWKRSEKESFLASEALLKRKK